MPPAETTTAEADRSPDRPYHHGDLPEALMRAVDTLLRDDGVTGLSLRKVARRAGVSHTAAAHHFGGWSGLLSSYTERGFRAFVAALEAASAAAGPDAGPEARLMACGEAYVDFALAHPGRYEVMFRHDLHDDDHEGADEAGQAAFGVLVDHVTAGVDATADEATVLRVAVTAWSTVHGLAGLLIDGVFDAVVGEDREGELRDAVMHMLRGALHAEPAWRGDVAGQSSEKPRR